MEGLIFGILQKVHRNVIHVVYCLCIFKPTRCFKIDLASLTVRSKFTVFALFYFVFEGNFPSTSPRGAYIWRGDLTDGFLRYRSGGLIFGGAYFRNFTLFEYMLKKLQDSQSKQ